MGCARPLREARLSALAAWVAEGGGERVGGTSPAPCNLRAPARRASQLIPVSCASRRSPGLRGDEHRPRQHRHGFRSQHGECRPRQGCPRPLSRCPGPQRPQGWARGLLCRAERRSGTPACSSRGSLHRPGCAGGVVGTQPCRGRTLPAEGKGPGLA